VQRVHTLQDLQQLRDERLSVLRGRLPPHGDFTLKPKAIEVLTGRPTDNLSSALHPSAQELERGWPVP